MRGISGEQSEDLMAVLELPGGSVASDDLEAGRQQVQDGRCRWPPTEAGTHFRLVAPSPCFLDHKCLGG